MNRTAITAAVLLACAAMTQAAIVPTNPDWVIYRDPFGATEAELYDQYIEVAPGETFTLEVIVNRDPPAGVGYLVVGYTSAFWYDQAVVANSPVPNYATSWMVGLDNPPVADFIVNGYVQLTNMGWNYLYMWEDLASNPYVVVGWDITILPSAPLGETTLPMKFRTYGPGQVMIGANSLDTDPAFIINVVPEPATMSLLALGSLAALRRRKQ